MRKSIVASAIIAAFFMLTPIEAPAYIFEDDFTGGASPLWSNSLGNWTTSGGVYYAQNPSDNPITYNSVPFYLKDFTVSVDVNNIRDGGIFLRSSFNPNNNHISGVYLVFGGHGGRGNGLYWQFMHDENPSTSLIYNEVTNLFIKGESDANIKIVVTGYQYSTYVNNNYISTFYNNQFTIGKVALFDNGRFPQAERQSFDNFKLETDYLPGSTCINENHYYQGLFNLGSHLTFDYKWDVAAETPPGQTWDVFYVQIEDPQWGWRTLKQFDTNKDTDWLLADIAIDPQDQGLKTLRFSVTDFGPDTDPTVCLQGLSPVPLPGSLMLMFSGLLGLILSNRAKK